MTEIPSFPVQVVPHNESDTANDDQGGYGPNHHPVPGIGTQGTVLLRMSHQVKPRITERGYGMEYAIPGALEQAILRNKTEGQYDGACSLKNGSAYDNPFGQLHHAANLQRVDALFHKAPFL